MKNMRKLFVRDLIKLLKNPLAFLIALGLCIIPALYAWFNIYSNWDPYGSTGEIPIALASKDMGYEDAGGNLINVPQDVIDEMIESESINYIKVLNSEDAIEGVKEGKYYAAVVFQEDFTRGMYEGVSSDVSRPKAIYYENEKKNAVAIKITDTAVENLKNKINREYVTAIVTTVFSNGGTEVGKVDVNNMVETVSGKVKTFKGTVDDFSILLKQMADANDKLEATLEDATGDLKSVQDSLNGAKKTVQKVPSTDGLIEKIESVNDYVSSSVDSSLSKVDDILSKDIIELKSNKVRELVSELEKTKAKVDKTIAVLKKFSKTIVGKKVEKYLTKLTSISKKLGQTIDSLNKLADLVDSSPEIEEEILSEIRTELESVRIKLEDIREIVLGNTTDALKEVEETLSEASTKVTTIINNAQDDIDLIEIILGNGNETIELANEGFGGITSKLDSISMKCDEILSDLELISNAAFADRIVEFLQRDAETYGYFFAEPVKIQTKAIYPVDNYGSGMTPFYTTLALWVGGVVLVSLIKVKANTDGLVDPKPYELFLGRYALFFLLSVIQCAVIVIGNLYLLKIQCQNPGKFFLASLLTSITFSLLIYTFTISFGDIGKAFIVVIMVIQIAGSSGSYPIEILPEFYRKVYIFFPFPYAINAMREAIAGQYESDYAIYLIELLIFAVVALFIGLFVRLPFAKINHFVEKRMEDTEMM